MKKLRNLLRKSKFLSLLYYGLHIDDFIFSNGWFGFDSSIKSAMLKYLSPKELEDERFVKKIRKDIIKCYRRYKCLPSEYFLFNFRNLTDYEKSTYVTDTYINSTLTQVVGRKSHDKQLNDKWNFYCLMKPYFKRKVFRVDNKTDYDSFKKFVLEVKHIIAKPNDESVGSGIRVFHINTVDDAKNVFYEIKKPSKVYLLEELIIQNKEMARWNESSVNTVRVSAFLNRNGFFILSSIIRTGRRGSVIDNAGHGGISAAIDPQTGIIISDGMDKKGLWYKVHPDTGASFYGYQIPHWSDLVALTEEIHRTIPNQIYVGWDFALTDDGWVLIEGNWGQLGSQQVALGYGLKPRFEKYLYAK